VAIHFGGQSQLMRHWNLLLSLVYHSACLWATLLVQPHPIKYNHLMHRRRERIYAGTARLGSLMIPFSSVVAVTAAVLSLHDSRVSVQHRREFLPDHWGDYGVAAQAWGLLFFSRPRHWMCGASRFLRKRQAVLELDIGDSGVHAAVWAYIAWACICQMVGGRWAYPALQMSARSTTGAGFALQVSSVAAGLQSVAWIAWRMALAVAPRARVLSAGHPD